MRPFVAVFAVAALALFATSCGGEDNAPKAERIASPQHPALWHNEALFFDAVRAAESMELADAPIAGGIVPHDWLGGRYITWFFRSLAQGSAPETVVLVGPNHDNEGPAKVLTSALPWATPFGAVEPDEDLVTRLLEEDGISIDDRVLATEHSVAGLMPAIAYYLPDAKVVPVILRGGVQPDEAARIGELLAGWLDDGDVLVAAVDFSHELTQGEAARNNAVTLQAIEAGDAASLFGLDNRYLDSPPSIAVLMRAMSLRGGAFVFEADSGSAALRGDELAPTTSYIVGYYTAGTSASQRWTRSSTLLACGSIC